MDPNPTRAERARRRGVWKGPQGRDKVIPIKANLTPEAWATWEPILAKWAAPGMCNPADEHPCYSGTPTQAQIDNDHPHPGPAPARRVRRGGAQCAGQR